MGYDLSTEAMLLRALQHPLVVKYYDFVEPLEIRRFGFGLLLTELYGCEWNSKNPLIADETGLPPIMDPFHPGNHQRSLQQLIETCKFLLSRHSSSYGSSKIADCSNLYCVGVSPQERSRP